MKSAEHEKGQGRAKGKRALLRWWQRMTLRSRVWAWLRGDFLGIFREFHWSYRPPLMVYFAAGISGFTGIVESFFVKKELALSAAFLAGLGFWAGLPWALKMPAGHLVDLFWPKKAWFVYAGAAVMAASLLIMVGLTGNPDRMAAFLPVSTWYILSVLLAPVGYMLQDVVADAMTVEAVPAFREDGSPFDRETFQRMHVTMQTLGRVAIVGGGALVAGVGGWLAEVFSYETMYEISLVIPVISVSGVILGGWMLRRRVRELRRQGLEEDEIRGLLEVHPDRPSADWAILGGSAAFVAVVLLLGLSGFAFREVLVLAGSLGIIGFLMRQLLKGIDPERRREIVGIAIVIFVYRAMPTPGPGAAWWQIDVLGFDEAFFGTLRQVASVLAIVGMLALRGWMGRRSVPYIIVFLSIYNAVMGLPFIGMFYGIQEWTQEHFGFGAHTIALIDTMADSPMGQVAMIPMLAWIAREAPREQKATYFAVLAAFTNLALSASNLATQAVNEVFVVRRGQYGEVGILLITVALANLFVPVLTVILIRILRARPVRHPSS
jgi:hypothetical protein